MRASSIANNLRTYPAAFLCAAMLVVYFASVAGAPGVLQISVMLGSGLLFGAILLLQLQRGGQWMAVVLILGLVVIALGIPSTGWDARSIWLFHAKRIFFEGNAFAQLDGYAGWSHNDYPSLLPVLMASVAQGVGHWNEVFPKALVPLAMAPALMVVSRRLGTTEARLVFAATLFWVGGSHLVDGYMDVLLALTFVATFILVSDIVAARQPAWPDLLQAGLMGSILTLIKNEGAVLLLCVAVAGLLLMMLRERRIHWSLLLALAVSILPLLFWKLAVSRAGLSNDLADSELGAQLAQRFTDGDAYVLVAKSLLLQLPSLLLGVPLIILALFGRWRSASFESLLVCTGYLCVLIVVYLSTPNDLAWHLSTSNDRTLLPIWLLAAFAVIRGTLQPANDVARPQDQAVVLSSSEKNH